MIGRVKPKLGGDESARFVKSSLHADLLCALVATDHEIRGGGGETVDKRKNAPLES